MFCPKCGSMLVQKLVKGKKMLACSCGFSKEKEYSTTIKEAVKGKNDIEVIEEVETKPLVDARCGKCGNKKAYFWTMQTRASDEPETRFFRCEKCRHTWREYS